MLFRSWFYRLWMLLALWCGLAGFARADIAPPDLAAPTTVKVYLSLEDINDIRLDTGTFDLTAQLVLQWKDPRLAFESPEGFPRVWRGSRALAQLEKIWHPVLDISGEKGLSSTTLYALMVAPDGTVTTRQKFTTRPRFTGELAYYPFGRLNLNLNLSSMALDTRHIVFELMDLSPSGGMDALDAVLHGNWRPTDMQWAVRTLVFSDVPGHTFPQISLTINVEHDFLDGLHKVFLPMFVIAMASWGLLWVNFTAQTSFSSPRIGGIITLILTTIALKFALSRELPLVHYLTLTDILFNTTIIMLSFAMLSSCVVAGLFTEYTLQRAQWLNRWLRRVYPFLYLLVLVVSCLWLLE